jgi:hypothetical protein
MDAPPAEASAPGKPGASAVGRVRRGLRKFFLLSTACMAVVHVATLAVVIPQCEKMCRNSGVELPALTRAFVAFSRWVMGHGRPRALPGALPLGAAAIVVAAGLVSASRRRWGLLLLMLADAALVVMLGLFVVAMFLPVVSMIESAASGP